MKNVDKNYKVQKYFKLNRCLKKSKDVNVLFERGAAGNAVYYKKKKLHEQVKYLLYFEPNCDQNVTEWKQICDTNKS